MTGGDGTTPSAGPPEFPLPERVVNALDRASTISTSITSHGTLHRLPESKPTGATKEGEGVTYPLQPGQPGQPDPYGGQQPGQWGQQPQQPGPRLRTDAPAGATPADPSTDNPASAPRHPRRRPPHRRHLHRRRRRHRRRRHPHPAPHRRSSDEDQLEELAEDAVTALNNLDNELAREIPATRRTTNWTRTIYRGDRSVAAVRSPSTVTPPRSRSRSNTWVGARPRTSRRQEGRRLVHGQRPTDSSRHTINMTRSTAPASADRPGPLGFARIRPRVDIRQIFGRYSADIRHRRFPGAGLALIRRCGSQLCTHRYCWTP